MSTTHTGIAIGPKKGFIVTKRATPARCAAKRKGASDRIQLIRQVVREVTGFSPYERRIMELIKIGTTSSNKRALKFSKKRLGTHKRGKKKREEMFNVVVKQRRAEREGVKAE